MNSYHLVTAADGLSRCWWCGSDPLYVSYHDEEWGFPVIDDRRLFEKLCLEGFQAGLSWITVLRKRENFRSAFCRFDPDQVARFSSGDVQRLLQDSGIIRHRGKIESTINNARRVLELQRRGETLASLVWEYAPEDEQRPVKVTGSFARETARTPCSARLSRELKSRGFTFVGPTTVYSFMQAMGLVNDHVDGCAIRPRVEAARSSWTRPGTSQ